VAAGSAQLDFPALGFPFSHFFIRMETRPGVHWSWHHGCANGCAPAWKPSIRWSVNSRTESKANRLVSRGAQFVSTPAEVAANSDVVLICVTDTPDVVEVVRALMALLASARAGLIVIDHSTDLALHDPKNWPRNWPERGTTLLDAPVSGGDVAPATARFRSWSAAMPMPSIESSPSSTAGDHRDPLRPQRQRPATKLVNQILVSVTNLRVCEALTFARKHDLKLDKTIAALAAGPRRIVAAKQPGPADDRRRFSVPDSPSTCSRRPSAGIAIRGGIQDLAAGGEPGPSALHWAQAAGHAKDGTQALFYRRGEIASLH